MANGAPGMAVTKAVTKDGSDKGWHLQRMALTKEGTDRKWQEGGGGRGQAVNVYA
jgi:hypothetical protein